MLVVPNFTKFDADGHYFVPIGFILKWGRYLVELSTSKTDWRQVEKRF